MRFLKRLLCFGFFHDYNIIDTDYKRIENEINSHTKTYWCSRWWIETHKCRKCGKTKVTTTPDP